MTMHKINYYFYTYSLLIMCSYVAIGSCLSLQGAEPLLYDQDKNKMLIQSAISNDLDAVDYSLFLGANVNFADELGNTPLIYASHKGYESIVKCLMCHGANHKISNGAGKTAIEGAQRLKCKNIHEILTMASNPQGACFLSVLKRAVENEDESFLRWLVSLDVQTDGSYYVALSVAARKRNLSVFKILLAADADIDKLYRDGAGCLNTLLSTAFYSEKAPSYYPKTARFLLDNGANLYYPDAPSPYKNPLMSVLNRQFHGASVYKPQFTKLLLSRGALFSAEDLKVVSFKKYKALLLKNEEIPYNYFASVRSILEQEGLPVVLAELTCIDMLVREDMKKKVRKKVSVLVEQRRNKGLPPRKRRKKEK